MYCYVLGTDGAVQYYPANNSSNLSMVTAGQTINGSSLLLPPEVERSILNMAQGVGDILELAAFPLPVLIIIFRTTSQKVCFTDLGILQR
jgi:hypothetical protein